MTSYSNIFYNSHNSDDITIDGLFGFYPHKRNKEMIIYLLFRTFVP